MIALFCGSQLWSDPLSIFGEIQNAWKLAQSQYQEVRRSGLVIMHGAAPGADTIAGSLAELMGYTNDPHPADWKQYGKPAGMIRNNQMLDLLPDHVYAFCLNSSPGTQHTINEASKRGIPLTIHERFTNGSKDHTTAC